jgi:hypothetical protein
MESDEFPVDASPHAARCGMQASGSYVPDPADTSPLVPPYVAIAQAMPSVASAIAPVASQPRTFHRVAMT